MSDIATAARELVATQRTLTLASHDADGPWSAPVYYLFHRDGFYFFSNPASRHIAAGSAVAASLYRDSDDWRDIEGMQMSGEIAEVGPGREAATVFARYLQRYPTVMNLFGQEQFDLSAFTARFKARLYRFTPAECYYLNNRLGFGKRQPVRLGAGGGARS